MMLELAEKQTEGRGVNEVPLSCEESPNHVNMAIMADLVHKKMWDIVTDGGERQTRSPVIVLLLRRKC